MAVFDVEATSAEEIARQRLELLGLEPDVREGGGVPNVVRGQAHGFGV